MAAHIYPAPAARVARHWPAGTLPVLAGLRSSLPILLASVASAAAYVTAAAPADLVRTRLACAKDGEEED